MFPLRLAAIDIGSNGMRLACAEFSDARTFHILEGKRAAVRLGGSVFRTGRLDPTAMDAAMEALRDFRHIIEERQITRIRAVATSAVRESRESRQFVKRARQEAGVDVRVISGAEEARLVHAAVANNVELGEEPWMMMDLGGGSIEIALIDGQRIHWSESRPHGSVRLMDEHLSAGEDTAQATRHIHDRMDDFRLLHASDVNVAGLIATGGNINYLAKQAGFKPSEDDQSNRAVPVDAIRQLVEQLEPLSPQQRQEEYGMRPDRADVVVAAGQAYLRVAHLAGVDSIHVPGCGVKEGILLDLALRLSDPKAHAAQLEHSAEEAAIQLGRTLGFNEQHATQVASLALSLFDDLQDIHGLDSQNRIALHVAALLHDAGRIISDAGHHKHSAYLIRNAQLPGLANDELALAALVARYHRKAKPKKKHRAFAALDAEGQQTVRRLAALLRVAEALDRSHQRHVAQVHATAAPESVTLHIQAPKGANLEAWAVQRRASLFSQAFHRTLQIDITEKP